MTALYPIRLVFRLEDMIVFHYLAVLEAKIGTTATPSNWWAGGPAHWCSVLCVGHAGQNVPPIAAPCACNAENQHALFRNTNWHSCLLRHNSVHCLRCAPEHGPHPRWCSGNGGAHLALAPEHRLQLAPCGANKLPLSNRTVIHRFNEH